MHFAKRGLANLLFPPKGLLKEEPMNPKSKMVLVDMIIDYIAEHSGEEATKEYPRMVGKLNAPLGLIGFKRAEPGTPVFERADRYIVILETLDGKSSLELSYYKESLKPVIDFNTALGSVPEALKKST